VFTRASKGWRQTAELKGSDTVATGYGDNFEQAIAILSNRKTIVVGAPAHDDNAGRVYVSAHATTGWKRTAELKGSDTRRNDAFGSSVSASGTTVAVGAPNLGAGGRVYLFVPGSTSGRWEQVAELADPDQPADTNKFAWSTALRHDARRPSI
jgi:hypothetical protein